MFFSSQRNEMPGWNMLGGKNSFMKSVIWNNPQITMHIFSFFDDNILLIYINCEFWKEQINVSTLSVLSVKMKKIVVQFLVDFYNGCVNKFILLIFTIYFISFHTHLNLHSKKVSFNNAIRWRKFQSI